MTVPNFALWGRVTSLPAFLSNLEAEKQREVADGNKADFVFRGQRVADWKLEAKAARVEWKGNRIEMERRILEEFARTTPRFPFLDTDNEWDRMAVAQHHGLPTRLMDWTYSALAALWFAVEDNAEPGDDGVVPDGVVWILKAHTKDYINRSPGVSPFDHPRSWVFRPRIIADRIQAQSGVFVVHAAIDDRFIPLEVNSNFTSKLIKVPIAAEHFQSLREELHLCGINHASMFPDLDGMCRHLTWRYTH
jgi:hypothetical protein